MISDKQEQQQQTDIEAIQAQIDLSNSVALDIVSSWLKPSSSTTTINNNNIARDLEEFARRPPRLGLGATVSKSTAATLRETARLKGKLTQKSVDSGRSDGTLLGDNKTRRNDDDDEEEESRNTAIGVQQKKSSNIMSNRRAVVDVFAPHGKKRKRRNSHSDVLSATPGPVSSQSIPETNSSEVILLSSSTSQRKDQDSGKSKGKGKGKGKHKHMITGEKKDEESMIAEKLPTTANLFDEEWAGFSEDILDSILISKDGDGNSVHLQPQAPPSTPSSLSLSYPNESERQAVSLSPRDSRPLPSTSITTSPSTTTLKTDGQIPLLNLYGPPSSVVEGPSDAHGDKKRKKRRRRKKRKLELDSGQKHEENSTM